MDFKHKKTLAVPESARRCKKCRNYYPLEDFPWSKKDKYRGWTCSNCCAEYKRIWRRKRGLVKNPEKNRRRKGEGMDAYEGHISRKYNISLKEYNLIIQEQKSLCAICGEQIKLQVDHCHFNGEVRGLLCNGCNRAIGFFNDDPMKAYNAYKYLIKYLDCYSITPDQIKDKLNAKS